MKENGNGKNTGKSRTSSGALAKSVSLHLEGKRKEALDVLTEAIAAGECSADAHVAAALIQYELGLFDEAAASYEKLLMLEPGHPNAYFNAAICYERTGH